MNIPWENNFCILCLEEEFLTREHVIPFCIGGMLEANFLCKECNSGLGSNAEAKIKESPEIRRAIANLSDELPELMEKIEARQQFLSEFGGEKLRHKLGRDGVLGEGSLADGSIIVPDEKFQKHLCGILKKNGANDHLMDQAFSTWASAPDSELIELPHGVTVKKWKNVPATASMDGPPLGTVAILKIAYEFMALCIGEKIQSASQDFDVARKIILDNDEDGAQKFVLKFEAKTYQPFHGICFEGNCPTATFQVRLFGKLAYRVIFSNTKIEMDRVVYTFDLSKKAHDLRVAE